MHKPSSEEVFSHVETVLIGALTNPVTAATKASIGVLTNPFKVNRKSFRKYYGQARRYSNKVENANIIVKSCCECDARDYGVETLWHSAGSVRLRRYESVDRQEHLYAKDTFCPEHKKMALDAQHIVRMAKGY